MIPALDDEEAAAGGKTFDDGPNSSGVPNASREP